MRGNSLPMEPTQKSRGLDSSDMIRIGSVISLVTAGLFMSFIIENQTEAIMVCLAVLCGLLAMIPMLSKRRYCAFEPATVLVALTLFCITAKVWMILGLDNTSTHVQRRLLLGYDSSVLHKGLWAALVAILCFSIGYTLRLPRVGGKLLYLPNFDRWDHRRLLLLSIVICSVAAVSLVLFAREVGFQIGDSLVGKRFAEEGVGGAERMFRLSYYYYRLAALAKFAFYLSLGDLLARKGRWLSLHGAIVVFAGLQSIAVSAFISNRAGIALLLLDAIVIIYFLRPRFVVPTVLLSSVIVSVLFFVVLASRKAETNDLSVGSIVEETIGGRDLMDISKTAHIINAVPSKLDYAYGETLWGWIAAPIPSSIWPGKPMWSARGVYLMHGVYGDMLGYTGMPPGLIAELYWNLGWYGIIFGMLTMGIMCQWMFRAFQPFQDRVSCVVIYALVLNRLVLFSLGNDLGTGIVKTALDIVPLAVCILLISKRRVVRLESADESLLPDKEVESMPPALAT